MVITTIRFRKQGVIPPVYLAGTFTEWQAKELDHKRIDSSEAECLFSTTIDVPPGKHQYKLRLGPGDWWVTDDSVETSKQCRDGRR